MMKQYLYRSRDIQRWSHRFISFFVLWVCGCLGDSLSASRPNIVFIFSDDHALQRGAYGSGLNETPHIDRIAHEGRCSCAVIVATQFAARLVQRF